MSDFPKLKSEAVAQYPLSGGLTFATKVTRFSDGTEQRYRNYGGPLRTWVIALSALDGDEISRLETFFMEQNGSYGVFAFTDPWDGVRYENCTLQNPEALLVYNGLQSASLSVTIQQRRA